MATFLVHVRQYATGETFAVTDHEIEEDSVSLQENADNSGASGPYREFAVEITSEPPKILTEAAAGVTIPDEAASGLVTAQAV